MSDINLFHIKNEVKELKTESVLLEKEIQTLIENNMETFFGVRFLATEYAITNGRMDSIGIDENNCPVIFEYKRSSSENIINQGLFYLDWLLDHKADFQILVMEKLGNDVAKNIDWSAPSVFCIAKEFTKFDEYAINQMQRNIKLVKYNKYENDLILFEHINTPVIKAPVKPVKIEASKNKKAKIDREYNWEDRIKNLPQTKKDLYFSLRDYILSKGDDITETPLKFYMAFKKVKNFICVSPDYVNKGILVYLKLIPEKITMQSFMRNVKGIGHQGTGDVEAIITNVEEYEILKSYIDKAYNEN